MKENDRKIENIIVISGIVFLIVIEFIAHIKCNFVMDDLWYSTNLVTGNVLQSFSDIVDSQIWHFFNWGGRNITHGILQLTLMSGENVANILNVIMMLLLVWLICILSGQKKVFWFLMTATLIVCCNANVVDSMLWQSGTVNYVYSSVWIFLFIWCYIRELSNVETISYPLISFWIIPLGLMTGWSNENMGPASCLISTAAIIYIKKVQKRKINVWMYLGSLFSFVGSVLVVIAPGNFVRTSELPETDLWTTFSDRILSMLRAGSDYLFWSVALFVIVCFLYRVVFKEKIKVEHWFLLAYAILSYGAMVLSPHYPGRATFGTMCIFIVLIISMLGDIISHHQVNKKLIYYMSFTSWFYAIYILCLYIS